MTLVTGGESPKHSKWHLITGSVVVLGAFVVTMFAVERHIGPAFPDSHAEAPQGPAAKTVRLVAPLDETASVDDRRPTPVRVARSE